MRFTYSKNDRVLHGKEMVVRLIPIYMSSIDDPEPF